MIKNFEEIKLQLMELSDIVNSFKSEAVQLRIVELVFGMEAEHEQDDQDETPEKPRKKTARRKRAAKKPEEDTPKKTSSKKANGQGAVATLTKLVDDGFFKEPKSIGNIVEHCDHNLARKFKANEFSGKLGRLVREGTLTRTKNSENQYEYQSK
ncbi:hypothetical protein BKP64_15525 [Marinobacter salinus]|uniref:Uncharacterized protein n=1 Tax=Marinobacter salinus TaxID=1874317 RepID=A0A1D9GP99_9GAMM|nr:hypothetical protein [Marinobacter salinus]AOY89463.1 hypothetical protein BKP64_15525 [Marinobacter salinus]